MVDPPGECDMGGRPSSGWWRGRSDGPRPECGSKWALTCAWAGVVIAAPGVDWPKVGNSERIRPIDLTWPCWWDVIIVSPSQPWMIFGQSVIVSSPNRTWLTFGSGVNDNFTEPTLLDFLDGTSWWLHQISLNSRLVRASQCLGQRQWLTIGRGAILTSPSKLD